MSEERTLLLSNAPLAFDAPECGQPWKARRVRRRRDNAGAAALEPIVPFLLSFVKGELAGRIGQGAGADRANPTGARNYRCSSRRTANRPPRPVPRRERRQNQHSPRNSLLRKA